ncbi:MAG: hypothetical protein Q8P31_10755 [Bacillota bacterium]|nr:hypothetical protein [Bacillota bacterium]
MSDTKGEVSVTEDCLCGSGRPMQDCCYTKYPSIAYDRESAASVDFYTRWAVNRHMLWRAISECIGPTARPPMGSLVVLGAGSCRDLPMDFLCASFREVVLVDKNPDALEGAGAFIPPDLASRVVRVCWDVNGPFGQGVDALIGEMRASGLTLEQAADRTELSLGDWQRSSLPCELSSRMPFGLVISDLILTQISLNYAFQCALALDKPLREIYDRQRNVIFRISRAAGRNHHSLLRLLSGRKSKIMILNDTFMLGREYDGSASLFNLAAEARGKDASDASWISASDIDAWLPEYSLLGSDLGGLTEETPRGGSSGMKLLGRTWWWWPHCAMRSYLIVCYILEPL